jgi:serine/threonine protein kinase
MQIGPYQLTRWLGHGGMGEVWLGKRVAMGSAAKVVAVKLLRTPNPEARDNLVTEARLAMLLHHSTIVQVNDVGESDDTCFMEMEWVDGLDLWHLQERLRETDQRLEIGVAAYIVGELLKALAFAHALDVDGKHETIVHRDVTPQNVLISRSGEVKLTDFGIAFMTSNKTSSGYIKGKSRYMSPEHVRHVREPCIDIFGVGAIFHEMLDGRKFRHTATSSSDLWNMALTGYVPPLSIELPVELEQLRRGLLAPDLGQRFASARAALCVLRRWPGYRDASDELERLVREAVDNEANDDDDDNDPPAASTPPTVVVNDDDEAKEPEGDHSTRHDTSETDISDIVLLTTDVQPAANLPEVEAPPRPHSRDNKRGFAAVLALVVVGVVGLGASMVVNHMREGEPSEAPDPMARTDEPPESTFPATAAHTSESPKLVVAEPPPAAQPKATLIEPPAIESPAKDIEAIAPTKPATKPKTEVTLAASGYPWVRIQIGSATYVLDRKSSPTRKISLKPGSHSIAFQVDDEEPMQKLGKVSIPARSTARLELQKSGKVVIE